MEILKRYEFNKDIFKLIPQQLKGVYGLIFNDEIIYIGKSIVVGNRLKTHYNANVQTILNKIYKEDGICNRCKSLALYHFIEENKQNMEFIIFQECSGNIELSKIEKYYIEKYKPKFNYQGVDVPYII